VIRPLTLASALGLLLMQATPAQTQDPCNHPITPQQWAAMTDNQRQFQHSADTVTANFITAVFGDGPYPPCLYQSVRDYFFDGSSPDARARSQVRREQARRLMLVNVLESTSEGQQPAAPGVGGDSVYSEADVQEKPERLGGPRPVYPTLLQQAQIEGAVMVEAIIDTLGHVEPNSMKVVQTANPGFNEPAKRSVLMTRFRPGRQGGKAVRVLVHLPIYFWLKGD